MILVEVGEFVIEKNLWADIVRDVKCYSANIGIGLHDSFQWWRIPMRHLPLRPLREIGVFERRRYLVIGNVCECGCRLAAAIGVVDRQLLYHGTRPQQQSTYRRKYDADGEENRKDGLGGENRSDTD